MKKKYFNTLLPNSKVKKNLYFCLCSLIKPLSRGPAFHPAVPDALLFAACLRPERHTPNDDRAPPLRSGKYRCGLGILFALSVKGTRPPECLVRRTDIEVEERRVRKQLYISVCQEFFTNFFQKIPALLCMTHEHRQDRRHAHRPQVLRQVGKHDLPRELTDDDKTVDERKSSPLGLLFDLFDAPRLCLAYFFSPRAA